MTKSAPTPLSPLTPALIVVVTYAVALSLHGMIPLTFLPGALHLIPALWLSLGGIMIFLTAIFALRKARTTMKAYATPRALVTTGPYRRSRNPIYLSFAWVYLGLGCLINSWWPLILFPVLILTMNRFVIAHEEAVLEKCFGEAYRSYRSSTRRWA
jgi:protein-S-isoprenylcysteine O-methyltransferase Ste14